MKMIMLSEFIYVSLWIVSLKHLLIGFIEWKVFSVAAMKDECNGGLQALVYMATWSLRNVIIIDEDFNTIGTILEEVCRQLL